MILYGERKVNLSFGHQATQLPQGWQRWGSRGLRELGHADPEEEGDSLTPANLRMRLWGFEHIATSLLLQPGSPSHTASGPHISNFCFIKGR